MFKGTEYLKAEQFDRLTEDVGGFNNAFTSDDVTGYHSVVPSNHLETLLWAEAERMMNLKVDEATFRSRARGRAGGVPRSACSPRRTACSSTPSRRSRTCEHPYKRSAIGSIEDLEAATLDDVVRLPRPLLPAGQRHAHRRRRLRCRAARCLGRQVLRSASSGRPTPMPACQRIRAAAGPPTGHHRHRADRAAARGGAGLAGAAAEEPGCRGAAGGRGGARRRRVVAAAPVARLPAADRARRPASRPTFAPGRACSSPMRSPPATSRSPRSAPRCWRRCAASSIRRRRRPSSTRSRTSSSPAPSRRGRRRSGWPRRWARRRCSKATRRASTPRIEELQRVTAADVRRVMRRYVLEAHKVTIDYRQAGSQAMSGAGRPVAASRPTRPRLLARASHCLASCLALAAASARAQPYPTPPPPAPPRPLAIAAPSERRARQRPARHRRAAPRRAARHGAAGRAVGQRGRSAAAGRPGRDDRDAARRKAPAGTARRELAAAAEALGGSLESGAGWHQSSVGITVTTPRLDAALALVAEVATEPVFARGRARPGADAEPRRAEGRLRRPGRAGDAGRRPPGVRRRRLTAHPAGGTPESLPRHPPRRPRRPAPRAPSGPTRRC